jgi:hypothetical protein
LAQEVAALTSCAAYLSTIKGEQERVHVMSLTGLAQRLSDELANSLDLSTFLFLTLRRRRMISNVKFNELENRFDLLVKSPFLKKR